MDVVVVESPAKAKTINRYLGPGYKVLASYGHVRDLPPKDGSVRPDEDFEMSWQVDPKAEKRISEIAQALRGAEHLYLATDPDREGEAISWHVREILKNRKALEGIDVKRVVFHEVTKDAVLDALKNPRDINRELVEAYLARRALDYLVGFTLSPVLWRKLPGSRSAGRVQSVALRLVCEREAEIEAFKPREYWSVEARFRTGADAAVRARLTHLDGTKLDRYDLADQAAAERAADAIRAGTFHVSSVERKSVKRHPYPPFITSTLQQEASRKLGFGAQRTMRLAQNLYEGIDIGGETVGLITYMRTDSVVLAKVAVDSIRALIGRQFGKDYVPAEPRAYKSTAKNAQEAHEAIRPTDVTRRPEEVARHLDPDARRLYELIWKRAVASMMESATLEQTAVDITSGDRKTTLRATGQVVLFDGFLKLYREDRDDAPDGADPDAEDSTAILPRMERGDAMGLRDPRNDVIPEQHFTKPPPRYTEASLVKRLEELGIGRPSTYASILGVLQDRNYVRLESRRFIPEDRGRLVTTFLTGFFRRYVEYGFTADLESKLDDISGGQLDWKQVLREFWQAFSRAVADTKDLTITNVIEALDAELGPHLFPVTEPGKDLRGCPACGTGRLGLKLGKHGAFIGCSNYPECAYTRPLTGGDDQGVATPRELGFDPETGKPISLRKGPYGLYVQLGESENGEKPKRASLPKGVDPETVDLERARGLLTLPREVGRHPGSGEMITAGIGRFGPYLKHGSTYVSLKEGDDVLTVGLNRAVTLIDEKPKRGGPEPLRTLGDHPEDQKPVAIYEGRYGPYAKHGRINATLPREMAPNSVTLDQAVALLAEKGKPVGRGRRAAAKGTTRKAAGKGGAKKSAAKAGAKKKTKEKAPEPETA